MRIISAKFLFPPAAPIALILFVCVSRSQSTNNRSTMPNSSSLLTTLSGRPVPIIYGTAWKKERTTELVLGAILAGFRGIDTACQPKHYSEDLVGLAVAEAQKTQNIRREDLFLQTKFTSLDGQDPARIPYGKNAPLNEQVRQSFAKSLANLKTDYLDSLVLHGPMRNPEENKIVWRIFEEFHSQGKAKRIGLSNFYDIRILTALYKEANVKPTILQNRFYPQTGYDREIREFCRQNGIVYQSFWTLTANPHALRSSVVKELAKKYGKTAEQIFFRFTMDIGITPLTGTTNRRHMEEDLAVPGMDPLNGEEIAAIQNVLFQKDEF